MKLVKQDGVIRGVKVCRKGPQLTHLMFVDDCLLFEEAMSEGATVLKEILRDYEDSEQCINFEKSTAFFSPNTIASTRDVVSQRINIKISTKPEKYLGLPNMV